MDDERSPREPTDSLAVANHSVRPPAFSDREMWIAIRGYLLEIVRAIDLHAERGPLTTAVRQALLGIAKAIELRWNLKGRRPSR